MKIKIKLISLFGFLLIFSSISTGFASDNVFKLEQVKELVVNNCRELIKYDLSKEKQKNKLYQAKDEYDDAKYSSYYILLSEYLFLQQELANGNTSVETRIAQLEKEMDAAKQQASSHSEKIASLSDKKRDAQDSYDDAVIAEENYKKQLEYTVEELYITILNKEKELEKQIKDYELKMRLLNIERKKVEIGKSTQDIVDQIAIQVSNINIEVINLRNSIKSLKGKLNDMMGREYSSELELIGFEVNSTAPVPVNNNLFQKILNEYDEIPQLERDIKQRKGDLDDANIEDIDYQSELVDIEIKEMELQLAEKKLELEEKTNKLITDFKTKQKAYQLAELELKNAEKKYNWDKKRFEIGQISKISLLTSELDYEKALNNKIFAGYDFFLAKRAVDLAEQGIL